MYFMAYTTFTCTLAEQKPYSLFRAGHYNVLGICMEKV